MPDPAKRTTPQINVRAPSIQRRFIASQTDDPNTLIALASDESYFVRRQAVQNPNTPAWILDLLVRAGATPDLRGRGRVDLDLDGRSLRKLVETGPWARQLVAEHPNATADVLAALKNQPSVPLRRAVGAHPNADATTLATLCCDSERAIRATAVANPNCPPDVYNLLVAAGAAPDLQGVGWRFEALDAEQLTFLADLGPWGRFLAARHPASSEALLTKSVHDPDWRIRSGLLDNPHTPDNLIADLLTTPTAAELAAIKCLGRLQIDAEMLAKLVHSSSPEVRLALARHPAATAKILGILATDGEKEIRFLAATHPQIDPTDLQRLVSAGSTPDLMGLQEPVPTLSAAEIQALLAGGIWARQLAVRHPQADADTVARLLCDREPKIREWAAVHPNLAPATKQDLLRAGSGSDFQGIMPPDPQLSAERLWEICKLGSWGEWVVANNPYAPAELLDFLANSDDWQVRLFVSKNPATSQKILDRLVHDPVEEIQKVL